MRDDLVVCDNIDSLAVDGSPEVTGVTAFIQEACESTDVLGAHYVPTPLNIQSDLQDLTHYFARPRLVQEGSVGTSRGRIYLNTITPNGLFTAAFPNAQFRLTGVHGLTFKIVFTVQVAATPFHQGLMVSSFQYNPVAPFFDRAEFPPTCINLPHVKLDLSTDTMCQLHVPWLYEDEYVKPNGTAVYGLYSLSCMMPTPTVAGQSLPTYKVYVHLEDLQFVGAAPAATSSYIPQAGKPMNVEFEQEAYPFSSSLSSFSKGLKFLSKGVPMVSSIAGPPAWFLSKMAGAVRSFGYSKPQIQEPFRRVTPFATVGENNVDIPSATVMAGPLASNQLQVSPYLGHSDVDEMSLAYVCSQYSCICYGTMAVANPHASTLYGTYVTPSFAWFRGVVGFPTGNWPLPVAPSATTRSFMPSSLLFWSSMFRCWRGSIKFRITFAKTKFHAGRVMALYVPDYTFNVGTPGNTAPSIAGPEVASGRMQPFGQSSIFDLKDSNVFEFVVPYIAPTPFVGFQDAIGSFTLSVMDPLVAPGSVAQSVEYMVEIAAGPDFELAIPCGPRWPAAANNSSSTIYAQSGAVMKASPADACKHTVGECVTSVKQLIMLPSLQQLGSIAANSGVVIVPTPAPIHLLPWYYQPPNSTLLPATTVLPACSLGWGGNCAACYTYVSGSTDVHLYPTAGGVEVITGNLGDSRGVRLPIGSGRGDARSFPATAVPKVITVSADVVHVRVPAYQYKYRVPSSILDSVSWNPKFTASGVPTGGQIVNTNVGGSPITLAVARMSNRSSGPVGVSMSRNAGEDARCAHYVGPPPLALVTPSVSTQYDPDWNDYQNVVFPA